MELLQGEMSIEFELRAKMVSETAPVHKNMLMIHWFGI